MHRPARKLAPFIISAVSTFPALADEVSEAGVQNALEEVIVNARRREELLQDTPVSVSAFGAEQMAEAGIHSMTDLEQHVPNLQFSQSMSKNQVIFIRGMGQRTDVSVFDPSVGVYLNNILIPRHDSALLETVDVQSVQVLRGPQGTLFGKNNTGGAILFNSAQPDFEEFSGSFYTRFGSHGRRDGRFSANLPLLDERLGARVSLSGSKLGGYVDNVLDEAEYIDEDRHAASLRLLWNATDTFSADVFAFWSRTSENGLGPNCIFQNPDASMPNLAFPGQPGYEQACKESQALAADRKVAINSEESAFKIDTTMLALTLDWAFADTMELSSITGFSLWDNLVRADDTDATAAANVANGTYAINRTLAGSGLEPTDEERWQLTQELQLSGRAFDERLHYTVGLFGSMEEITGTPVGSLVGQRGIGGVKPSLVSGMLADNGLPPLPGVIDDSADDTLVVPFVEWLGSVSDLENESIALFGEASADLFDWLQLTIGGRFTSELRSRDLITTDVDYDEVGQRIGATYIEEVGVFTPISKVQFDALADDPRTLPVLNPRTVSGSQRFEEFTPSATLTLLAPQDWLDTMRLDHFMTYLTTSKGFKAGGFDAKGRDLVLVEPEIVTNVEWGFKLDALANRLRVNVALFETDWQDMQLQNAELGDSITGSEILIFFTNAGAATTRGAELELSATLGAWFLQANASYLDAGYDEFIGSAVTPFVGENSIDRSDEPLYMAPELTYSITLQYQWLSPIGMLIPSVSYSHRDRVFTGLDFRAVEYESSYGDEYDLVNLRLGWLPSDELRVTLYVNNVEDRFYYSSGITNSDALGAAMLVQGPGRHGGLELHWQF